MTTYPLATLAAAVSATGISAPAYSDVLLSLQASYQGIFGSDAYLQPDSQDGQWLAIIASAINDSNQTAIAVYNQFSPTTAQGAGLSSVVKTSGITRLVSSASTCDVTIVGQAGTQITNGLIGDDQNLGTQWALPALVTIPPSGSIDATSTCIAQGTTTAAPGTLTRILTPTANWQSVTNAASAAPGAPVETDAALRQRQASSTALPSLTVLAGIIGAVESVTGVTQVLAVDNDTDATDANGVPANTLALVVQGGSLQSIVNAIGSKKTPGTQTYGNTSGTYVDPYGISHTINFSVPTQQTIAVAITLNPLTGYTSAIGTEIQAAVAAYNNALGIGQDVLISRLQVPAQLYGPYAAPASPTDPTTFEIVSITASISPATPGASDIAIAFNQIAVCATTNVTLTVT